MFIKEKKNFEKKKKNKDITLSSTHGNINTSALKPQNLQSLFLFNFIKLPTYMTLCTMRESICH